MSAANVLIRSLIGTPSALRLAERDVLTAAELVGEVSAVLEVDPVVGLPVGDDRPALVVGRLDGDDVIDHLLDDVGGTVDDVGALAEHLDVVGIDTPEVGQLLACLVGLPADRLCPSRPLAIIDLVDRFLGCEEQRVRPERHEGDQGEPDRDSADNAPS